jgi:hypothetical protein
VPVPTTHEGNGFTTALVGGPANAQGKAPARLTPGRLCLPPLLCCDKPLALPGPPVPRNSAQAAASLWAHGVSLHKLSALAAAPVAGLSLVQGGASAGSGSDAPAKPWQGQKTTWHELRQSSSVLSPGEGDGSEGRETKEAKTPLVRVSNAPRARQRFPQRTAAARPGGTSHVTVPCVRRRSPAGGSGAEGERERRPQGTGYGPASRHTRLCTPSIHPSSVLLCWRPSPAPPWRQPVRAATLQKQNDVATLRPVGSALGGVESCEGALLSAGRAPASAASAAREDGGGDGRVVALPAAVQVPSSRLAGACRRW